MRQSRAPPARAPPDRPGSSSTVRRFTAAAQLQRHQLLPPLRKDRHNGEHRHANHCPALRTRIEVELDDGEIRERPLPPLL